MLLYPKSGLVTWSACPGSGVHNSLGSSDPILCFGSTERLITSFPLHTHSSGTGSTGDCVASSRATSKYSFLSLGNSHILPYPLPLCVHFSSFGPLVTFFLVNPSHLQPLAKGKNTLVAMKRLQKFRAEAGGPARIVQAGEDDRMVQDSTGRPGPGWQQCRW